MGWCSGTEIFDVVASEVLELDHTKCGDYTYLEKAKSKIIRKLAEAMEAHDWDCQPDSDLFKHPKVKRIFLRMHPDWKEMYEDFE